MAVNWYEQGLNFDVWTYMGKCGRCGGTIKHKYKYAGKPKVELHIIPMAKIFKLMNGNELKLSGTIANMVTALNAFDINTL